MLWTASTRKVIKKERERAAWPHLYPPAGEWVMQVAISCAHLANEEREAGNAEGLHGYSGRAGCTVQLKFGATSEGC